MAQLIGYKRKLGMAEGKGKFRNGLFNEIRLKKKDRLWQHHQQATAAETNLFVAAIKGFINPTFLALPASGARGYRTKLLTIGKSLPVLAD
jgi:hypothetical protein